MAEMLMDETELSQARYFSELFNEGITRCSEFLNYLKDSKIFQENQDILLELFFSFLSSQAWAVFHFQ